MWNAAVHLTYILVGFTWAWFSGELDEMRLVYLPKDEE